MFLFMVRIVSARTPSSILSFSVARSYFLPHLLISTVNLIFLLFPSRRCAHHIAETLKPGEPHKKISEDAGLDSIKELDRIRTSDGPKHTSEIRLDMQKAMQVRLLSGRFVNRKSSWSDLFGFAHLYRMMLPCSELNLPSRTVSRRWLG